MITLIGRDIANPQPRRAAFPMARRTYHGRRTGQSFRAAQHT